MKLLYILSEYLPDSGGGIISYYAGILPYLAKAGHDVRVLVASRESLDRPDVELDGVQVSYLQSSFLHASSEGFDRFRVGYPAFSAFLPVAWAAYRQADAGKGFDLIETTDFPMLYAPWVACKGSVPVNITLHGSPGQLDWHDSPASPSMDSDLLRLVERAAFAAAPSVQANSDANAHFWGSRSGRSIPVLLPPFQRGKLVTPHGSRKQSGLVVGRLQLWKGPHVLCQALALVPETTVRWIGKDVTDPRIGVRFSHLLSREFPGIFGSRLLHEPPKLHDDILQDIAQANFLCVPSTWDVFNLTVVEAMSLGTPVICSSKAGAAMLIRYGENGFLFDPDQPDQLAACIRDLQRLSLEARDALNANAFATLEERLAPELLANERISYYAGLIKHGNSPSGDPWLESALSPRRDIEPETHILQSFTAVELAKAAARQIVQGFSRRLSRFHNGKRCSR